MTSFTVTISEGTGGYISTGYLTSGYVIAQTSASDTLGRTYKSTRTASQTLTITSAIKLGIVRKLAQTITNTIVMTRALVAIREIAQGSGAYTPTGYTTSGYLVDDDTTITDTLTRVRDVPRTISEGQVTLTDALARTYAALRTITRTITVTDTIGRTYKALRTISTTITNTNSVARALTAIRTITNTVTITGFPVAFLGEAGVIPRRIFTAVTSWAKRNGTTSIYKRKTNVNT